MTTIRRAIAFSFIESYLGLALSLVSFFLLARWLTPREVGLFSVTMAVISITQVIRDFGLVNFLIQKDTLSDGHIATAWGLALLLGIVLFAGIQLAAPLIGAFYHDPSLTAMARVVAINFLILPFNSVCLALLRRNMQFHHVMRINLIAAVLSTILTLSLAKIGIGALALALGAVLNNAIVAIGVWRTGAAALLRWPRLEKWREILRFGGPLTAANIINSVSTDINDLVVGKLMGFDAVAMVSRAQGLLNLFQKDFMNAVRNVALPAFSNANRSGATLELNYLASVNNVTVIAWTFYGFAALFPLEVLRLMFGPQWDRAAPLVPLFCLAGAVGATVSLIPTLMLSAGHSKLVASADLILQPLKALVLSLVVYFYHDLRIFALGFLAINMLSVPYFYAFKQRCLPTDFAGLGRRLARNALLTGLCLAPSVAVVASLRIPGQALPYAWFFACVVATCTAWPLLLWVFHHPLYLEAVAVIKPRLARPAHEQNAMKSPKL